MNENIRQFKLNFSQVFVVSVPSVMILIKVVNLLQTPENYIFSHKNIRHHDIYIKFV